MKRPIVKINMALLNVWMRRAVNEIHKDIQEGHVRYDYFTATDLKAAIRLYADRSSREDILTRQEAPWWGYNGWCRLVISDKPYGGDLLSICRDFLLHHSDLEGHNFGKRCISGARFRKKNSGLSEAEKKTIEKKEKPRPVHILEPNIHKNTRRLLCQAGIGREVSWRGYYGRKSRTTSDPSQVTCKRCLNLLAKAGESGQETASVSSAH